jgi:two-component system sensor histidine kinase TctE
MAQAIEAAGSLDDSKNRAAELVAETRKTMRLTQQMLSFEQINGREPRLIKTEINEFVQKFATRIGPRIMSVNIEFELKLFKKPIFSKIDPILMTEALTNLIDNAIEHSGPTITQIKLITSHSEGRVVIAVENDGLNIAHMDTDRLFDRFVQGAESKGAGLGLAIVNEAVLRQKGCVTLVTLPHTRFEVSTNSIFDGEY